MKNENRRAEGEQRTRRATEVARKKAIPRKSRRLACQIDHTRRFLYGRGVGKRERTHPGGKTNKNAGPKNLTVTGTNWLFRGGVKDGPFYRPPCEPLPENPILRVGVVCSGRPFFVVFLSAGVAKSPINSKQFELIRLEIL